jgi:hypothetical protein
MREEKCGVELRKRGGKESLERSTNCGPVHRQVKSSQAARRSASDFQGNDGITIAGGRWKKATSWGFQEKVKID